jgi:hypothetical protein
VNHKDKGVKQYKNHLIKESLKLSVCTRLHTAKCPSLLSYTIILNILLVLFCSLTCSPPPPPPYPLYVLICNRFTLSMGYQTTPPPPHRLLCSNLARRRYDAGKAKVNGKAKTDPDPLCPLPFPFALRPPRYLRRTRVQTAVQKNTHFLLRGQKCVNTIASLRRLGLRGFGIFFWGCTISGAAGRFRGYGSNTFYRGMEVFRRGL